MDMDVDGEVVPVPFVDSFELESIPISLKEVPAATAPPGATWTCHGTSFVCPMCNYFEEAGGIMPGEPAFTLSWIEPGVGGRSLDMSAPPRIQCPPSIALAHPFSTSARRIDDDGALAWRVDFQTADTQVTASDLVGVGSFGATGPGNINADLFAAADGTAFAFPSDYNETVEFAFTSVRGQNATCTALVTTFTTSEEWDPSLIELGGERNILDSEAIIPPRRSDSDARVYYTGGRYAIKGPHAHNFSAARLFENPFGGDADEVQYMVTIVPKKTGLIYIDQASGDMTVLPEDSHVNTALPAGSPGTYTATLIGRDAKGAEAVVRRWSFVVAPRPKLKFRLEYQGWEASSSSMLNESNGYQTVYAAAPRGSAAASYSLAAPPICLVDPASKSGDLVYSLSVSLGDGSGAPPPGKFFVFAATGETLVQPAIANDAASRSIGEAYARNYTGRLFVQDSSESAPLLIKEWQFRVLMNDVDLPEYGPNGRACENGAEQIDTVPFDKVFACACTGSFKGGNCESAAVADNTDDTTDNGPLVGSVLGVLAIVLVAAVVLLKYRARQLKNRPHDFAFETDGLVDMGIGQDVGDHVLPTVCACEKHAVHVRAHAIKIASTS